MFDATSRVRASCVASVLAFGGVAAETARADFRCDLEFTFCMGHVNTPTQRRFCRQNYRLCQQIGYGLFFTYVPDFDPTYGSMPGGQPWFNVQQGSGFTAGVGRSALDDSGFLPGPGDVDSVSFSLLPSSQFGDYAAFADIPFRPLGPGVYNQQTDRWEISVPAAALVGDSEWIIMTSFHDPNLPYIPDENDGRGYFHSMTGVSVMVPTPGTAALTPLGGLLAWRRRRS